MTTVAILSTSESNGEKSYRTVAGDKYSVGKTAGQALDALTAQLDEIEFSALLIIQSCRPDAFFSAEQQAELDNLVDMELRAAKKVTLDPEQKSR